MKNATYIVDFGTPEKRNEAHIIARKAGKTLNNLIIDRIFGERWTMEPFIMSEGSGSAKEQPKELEDELIEINQNAKTKPVRIFPKEPKPCCDLEKNLKSITKKTCKDQKKIIKKAKQSIGYPKSKSLNKKS